MPSRAGIATRPRNGRTLLVGAGLAVAGVAAAAWGLADVVALALAVHAVDPIVRAWTGGPGLVCIGASLAGAGALVTAAEVAPAGSARAGPALMAVILVAAVAGVAALALTGSVQGAILRALDYRPCTQSSGIRTQDGTWAAPGHACPSA